MSDNGTISVHVPFHETITEVPFDHIDRSDYNVPANQVINPALFHPSLRNDVECDDNYENCTPKDDRQGKSLLKVPIPTGAFWTNMIVPHVTGDGYSFPIVAYPYGFEWGFDTLAMSYSSLRRIMDDLTIRDIFNPDVKFKAEEPIESRYVTKFDPLSVSLRFNGKSAPGSNGVAGSIASSPYWETYLVQGSPWMTARYEGMTPVIHALSTFMGVDCPKVSDCQVVYVPWQRLIAGLEPYKLKGTQFIVRTQEDVSCILVTSKTVTIEFDVIRKTDVKFSEPFDGVLRYAFVPPFQTNDYDKTNTFPHSYDHVDTKTSTGFKALMDYSKIYPVGANVNWRFESSPASSKDANLGKIQFQFKTKSMYDDPDQAPSTKCKDDLLMLSLPHHTQVLTNNNILSATEFNLFYRTIKGYMAPVTGSCWEMEEPLTETGFDSPYSLDRIQNLNATVKDTILKNIKLDMKLVLPNLNENNYGYGKQVARVAQLAHITNNLKHDDDTEGMYSTLLNLLYTYVTDFLDGTVKDKLVYDTNLGGMVSLDGLKNSGADFGNGWYNDHHFHYGYILYACGILGKLNSTFAEEYGTHVDSIMFDVVYGENSNSNKAVDFPSFPFTRHKSWFDGHSFASGLFAFVDGKSQESSTESINCYYGAYLWSSVRKEQSKDVENFARLLLATEIRSVKLYWHMHSDGLGEDVKSDPSIYNPIFAKNLMVGNSAMTDVTVTTWFGNKPVYVHLINFMPITAITKEVFDKDYIEEEFNNIMKPIYDDIEPSWKGYAIADRAMIEPTEAWADALKVESFKLDSAISKSQLLYFIVTMEGFDTSSSTQEVEMKTSAPVPTNPPTKLKDNQDVCEENWKCARLGLTGSCCPTLTGVILSCCN